jgi:hypothetical protein
MYMKRIIFTVALLLGAMIRLQAQWDTLPPQEPVHNIIKLSPFHFAEGTFLLSYERIMANEKSSIMLLAGLHSREDANLPKPSFGFQEEVQYRFYVSPPKNTGAGGRNFLFFKGFYAGPYVAHRFRQQSRQVFDWILQANTIVDENINEVSSGVVIGAQIAFANRLFVDFYTGGGIKRSFGRDNSVQTTFTPLEVGYNGVIPKIGFQIGIGF